MSAVDPRLSAQQAQGEQGAPAAPMKAAHKDTEYNPAMSTMSKDALQHWLKASVSGKLDEVPGIATGNIAHFMNVDGQPGRTEADVIMNTYQLFGKFFMMRDIRMSAKDNVQAFFNWLRNVKGITSHTHDITLAVCEKANLWCPGLYNAADYEGK